MLVLVTASDDELDLLERWRGGDGDAGSRLFDRHFSCVFRFFRSKISGPVDDLVQRTFVASIEGRQRIQGDAGFRPYLLGCARNILFAEYRTRRKLGADADVGNASVTDLDPSPSAVVVRKEEHALLLRALRRLSLDHQIVLELYYFEGLRGPQLAAALDVPIGTVRSRLKRGLESLRGEVDRLASNPSLAASTMTGMDTWAGEIQTALERAPSP